MTDKTANPIPVIVGATGSGKSALALALAKARGAAVISADSRQVYKHLSIGTAKPKGLWNVRHSREGGNPAASVQHYLVAGVPHHLVDIIEPTDIFSAGDFAKNAEALLTFNGNAVIAGGTGLYLKALIDGLAPLPPADPELRKKLIARADKDGRPALHAALAQIDPDAAAKIPVNNIARLVRALEVHELTGIPISQWQREKTAPSPRRFAWFGLRWPKEAYEKNLAARCAAMLKNGMIEETDSLLKTGIDKSAPLFQSLGYRQVIEHLAGKITRAELEASFYAQSRLYAKRQMTWFRANPRIRWFDVKNSDDVAALAQKI
jgi:tRNA dimethylallyltransferase